MAIITYYNILKSLLSTIVIDLLPPKPTIEIVEVGGNYVDVVVNAQHGLTAHIERVTTYNTEPIITEVSLSEDQRYRVDLESNYGSVYIKTKVFYTDATEIESVWSDTITVSEP
jgi:hypothetical protein